MSVPAPLPDSAVLPASLAALFITLRPELLRQARAQGASLSDAEDAVSDAFLAIVRLPSARHPRNPRAYLHAIVRNALRRPRAGSREVATPLAELDRPSEDVDRLEADEQSALLDRALAALSDREQRLLRGSVVEGLGIDRLGTELGLSTTATTTAVARARANLRVAYLAATLEPRLVACGAPPTHLARVLLGGASERMRARLEQHATACAVCRGILEDR